MHRTQLSIEDWQYEALKAMSQRRGRSISDLVREILAKCLRARTRSAKGIAEIEGIGADREASGRQHDEFLYSETRARR